MDKKGESIRFENFENPWDGPPSSNTDNTIEPRLIFTIEGDPNVYSLALSRDGWESEEYILINLNTGKTVLKS